MNPMINMNDTYDLRWHELNWKLKGTPHAWLGESGSGADVIDYLLANSDGF